MAYQNVNDDVTTPYQSFQQQKVVPPQDNRPPKPPSRGLRTGAVIALALVIALVFGVGLFAGWEFGHNGSTAVADNPATTMLQPGSNPQAQATVPALTGNNIDTVREAVIAKVKPAVVEVDVRTQNGGGIGSGVIIDGRGYIVTNNHVVDGAQSVRVVLSDGTRESAQVVGTDPEDDLAVIKINPLGIQETVTSGIISALNRTVTEPGSATLPDAIQTDAPINPGNSGGALVDMQGNVIGIPTLTAVDPEFNTPANGVGFAIPSNRVKFIATQIIATGHVTHTGRAGLNITATTVDQMVAAQDNLAVDHGVLVVSVTPNGAAARAGIQAGDVIVQVNGQDISDQSALSDILATKNPGDKITVEVYRGNQQMTFNVTLGELQVG